MMVSLVTNHSGTLIPQGWPSRFGPTTTTTKGCTSGTGAAVVGVGGEHHVRDVNCELLIDYAVSAGYDACN